MNQLVAAMRSESRAPDLEERLASLRRILNLIEEREDRILDALKADLGKPPMEAWLSEVLFVKMELKLIIKKLRRWTKPRRVGSPFYFFPAKSEVRREPFGTVLVMAPWNYPFQLAVSPAIAAVAAGNRVVIKPSEAALATASVMGELIGDAVDPRLVKVIKGNAAVGECLLKQDFDGFFFTGGEKVGRLVAQAAAKRMVPCVLELGGKCPVVIHESADIDIAVERIVFGKFFNAGQTCMAPDFALVPEKKVEEFMRSFRLALERTYAAEGAEMARCVHEEQRERVLSLVPEGACQMGNDGPHPLRLAPRWAVVDWEDPCMREEIFGPFLPIVTYASEYECVEHLAARPSPLALYVFSKNQEFISMLSQRVRSGSLGVNDVMKQATNLNLPFGGVGGSGFGRYRGKSGFDTFTYERAVTKRYFVPDLFALQQPYGKTLERLRRWIG
ncbi:aldehyde dehydrogenase family protein [Haloferula chungangensis]|uniref:Aldehyde dehydrogenase n=1 Tax=Haloferula chungangensis TaxID=1048331 RepID=A0ABW2L5P7_9BACT